MNFIKNVIILIFLVVAVIWAFNTFNIDDFLNIGVNQHQETPETKNAPLNDTVDSQEMGQDLAQEFPGNNDEVEQDKADTKFTFQYPDTTTRLSIHPIGSFYISVESYPRCVKSITVKGHGSDSDLLKGYRFKLTDNKVVHFTVHHNCVDTKYLEKVLKGLSPQDKEFLTKKSAILREMLLDKVVVLLTEGSSSKVIEKEYYSVKNLRKPSHVDKFFITSPDLSEEGDVVFTPGVVEPHRQ